MKHKKILFGICGSFCNHGYILEEVKKLCVHNDVQIITSENVYTMDTRFHTAKEFIDTLKTLSGKSVWHTLLEAEKVGPVYLFDVYIIAPMTSTVLSKLRNGVFDHPITLSAKAHLRNNKTLVIGVSSNDLLSLSGANLMTLLNYKNMYFIPFYQDNPYVKPHSLVSEWTLLEDTMEYALEGKQIQPLLLERRIE